MSVLADCAQKWSCFGKRNCNSIEIKKYLLRISALYFPPLQTVFSVSQNRLQKVRLPTGVMLFPSAFLHLLGLDNYPGNLF